MKLPMCKMGKWSEARTSSCSLLREQSGSALLYVTISLAVLVGMAGLAIDVGRLLTTSTHAKQAADSAAIAAASQLDGTGDSITRAIAAAQTSPLIRNVQTLGVAPGDISIVRIRFLNGLPAGVPGVPNDASDLDPFVTTDPLDARFAEVTTEQVAQNNMFIQVVGAGATTSTGAVSVAGFTQTICKRAPFVICNPMETPTNVGVPFDTQAWKGRQIHVKASGPSSAWTPGDFGLADVDGLQSAPEIANVLAEDEPEVCVSALIDVKPGQTQSTRTGINTRFDMYDEPFFGKPSARANPKFRPAENVIKGHMPDDPSNSCSEQNPAPGTAMGLPRDTDIGVTRFGNGEWDCQSYWQFNHKDPVTGAPTTPPPGCTGPAPNMMSRHELYLHEIATGVPRPANTSGEDGVPQCHSTPPTSVVDRREIVFAVINCIEHGPIAGNSAGPIPVEAFVKSFITEPVGRGPDFNTFLEVIDIVKPGADDGILHDSVQLYR